MNNFNFDRCLKFVFTGGDLGTYIDKDGEVQDVKFVVEYNPRKASYLCPRLEAVVTDTPNSKLKNRPGYEAELKIYNPSNEILQHIASGITKITDYQDVFKYQKSKLWVNVYAGYYVEGPKSLTKEEKLPSKTDKDTIIIKNSSLVQDSATYGKPIFGGYVNNSLLTHTSTDTVLTLACHDIDMTQLQFNQIGANMSGKDVSQFDNSLEKKRIRPGKQTFDQNLRWLIQFFTGQDMFAEPKQASALDSLLATNTDYDKNPFLSTIRILYVTSPSAFNEAASASGISSFSDLEKKRNRSYIDENLRVRAKDIEVKNPLRTKDFYALKATLDETIDELCEWTGEGLGKQSFYMFGELIYCIYYKRNRKNTVDLDTDGIVKIINFQNLLATPAASPNGSLNIQMWFNKDCVCWKHIALVLDSEYKGGQEHTGVLNINDLNFASNKDNQLIVPLGGSTSNAAVATTQLSTTMAVAAVSHFQKTAAKNGYMFNVGFLMTKVVHKLSTHGKDWSTSVQTVPMMFGEVKGAKL